MILGVELIEKKENNCECIEVYYFLLLEIFNDNF